MKPHILWGFIWIQIVCKGHQRSSKFTASGYVSASHLKFCNFCNYFFSTLPICTRKYQHYTGGFHSNIYRQHKQICIKIPVHKLYLSHNLQSRSAGAQCNKLQECTSAISLFASLLLYNNVVTNWAQMTLFVMTLLYHQRHIYALLK